jgi:hypothetical protein
MSTRELKNLERKERVALGTAALSTAMMGAGIMGKRPLLSRLSLPVAVLGLGQYSHLRAKERSLMSDLLEKKAFWQGFCKKAQLSSPSKKQPELPSLIPPIATSNEIPVSAQTVGDYIPSNVI